jgi:hypothetical protein
MDYSLEYNISVHIVDATNHDNMIVSDKDDASFPIDADHYNSYEHHQQQQQQQHAKANADANAYDDNNYGVVLGNNCLSPCRDNNEVFAMQHNDNENCDLHRITPNSLVTNNITSDRMLTRKNNENNSIGLLPLCPNFFDTNIDNSSKSSKNENFRHFMNTDDRQTPVFTTREFYDTADDDNHAHLPQLKRRDSKSNGILVGENKYNKKYDRFLSAPSINFKPETTDAHAVPHQAKNLHLSTNQQKMHEEAHKFIIDSSVRKTDQQQKKCLTTSYKNKDNNQNKNIIDKYPQRQQQQNTLINYNQQDSKPINEDNTTTNNNNNNNNNMMANTHHKIAVCLPRSRSRSIAINKRSRPDDVMRDTINTSLQQHQQQQQGGREGNELYDCATWRMYNRIIDHRRRNNNNNSSSSSLLQSHQQQQFSSLSNQKNRIKKSSPSSSSSNTTFIFGKGIISANDGGGIITSNSSGLTSSMMYSHDVPSSEYYYPSDDDEYENDDEIFDLEL